MSGEAIALVSLSVKRTGRTEEKISYGSLSLDDGSAVLRTLEQSEKKSLATAPLEELVGKTPNPNRYGARRDNKRVTSLRESAVSHLRSPQVFQAIELIRFPQ